MSVRISCHKCSATLKVDDDFVDRKVVCPSCRSAFRIEKLTGDRQSSATSGTGTNENRDAQFVSVQVPPETPKKKRKGRASKKKQKARATHSRNPIRVLACLLIAGLATWFAFLRPTDQQLASVAPSQRTEADSASDPAAVRGSNCCGGFEGPGRCRSVGSQ
jgi:DNA-directed RNA polymerase subunit M/transcription elongation factor TFIIS